MHLSGRDDLINEVFSRFMSTSFVEKEVEKPKYRPGKIVEIMRAEGYPRFNMARHTELWRSLVAQDPAKGLGVRMLDVTWYWYESWVTRVRAHCEENAAHYR